MKEIRAVRARRLLLEARVQVSKDSEDGCVILVHTCRIFLQAAAPIRTVSVNLLIP